MSYAGQTDLEDAIGAHLVIAVFDDDGDLVPDERPIASCIAYANSEVDSYISAQIDPATVQSAPALKYAAVDFMCAYAARRKPEVMRAVGEVSWESYRKAAESKMDNFLKAKQRVVLASQKVDQANVQTVVKVAGVQQPADCPPGQWDDMGDF